MAEAAGTNRRHVTAESNVKKGSLSPPETRKRKRDALVNIENKEEKDAAPTARTLKAGSKGQKGAGKKPVQKKKTVTKETQQKGKKPKTTGQVPSKRQTSLLSFHTGAKASKKVETIETEDTEVEKPAATGISDVSTLVDEEEASQSIDDTVENTPPDVPVVNPGPRVVRIDASNPRASKGLIPCAPRPYTFKFDHRGSGFSHETYVAQVRDVDEQAPVGLTSMNWSTSVGKLSQEVANFNRKHETKYRASSTYLDDVQTDLNAKMRTILVDWLTEVADEYHLSARTFHKAVNLMDRCLAIFKITRRQFQLLGCACMMVASKFEEVYGPNVDEFVYISDQTYTAEEMLEMEKKVVQALEYRVASTTCYAFFPRLVAAGCDTDKIKHLATYLCDLALLSYRMLEFKPSIIASSCVYLARLTARDNESVLPWTPTLHHVSTYNAWDLYECVELLQWVHDKEASVVLNDREKAKALSEKYMSEDLLSVSALRPPSPEQVQRSFRSFGRP